MRTARKLVAVATLLILSAASAYAQSADQVIDKMIRAENEALKGIDNYVLKTEVMGITTVSYFEKAAEVKLGNGQKAYVMRNVPLSQTSRTGSSTGTAADASPEELEGAAAAMPSVGAEMEVAMSDSEGRPPGVMGDMLMASNKDEPWLSANPSDMTAMYATMLTGAAEGKRQRDADAKVDGNQWSKDLAALKAGSKIAGRETVNGTKTIVLESKGATLNQHVDDTDFLVERIRMWVDASKYVPVRMRIEGTMRDGKDTRAVVIERDDRDYRKVPGCRGMYEPFVSVMRMSGTLSAEEEAELQEAQAKLADLDQQLASMPPDQREMILRQMGPQRKMLESLASGSRVEIEMRLLEVRCNVGPPSAAEIRQTSRSAGPASPSGAPTPTPTPAAGAVTPTPTATSSTSAGVAVTPTSESSGSSAMTPAQEACLKERMAAAEAAKKRKRGLGRLLSVASKSAGRAGVTEVGEAVSEAQGADVTAQELKAAASDLGVTQDEIAACENAK